MVCEKKQIGISSSGLKIIAIITMLIDHFAYSIYFHLEKYDFTSYSIMRAIGRISFPIYCYLLIEGFYRTSNIKKYLSRMVLFALVSEVPFDMAFYDDIFYWRQQNVFFTLTLALIMLFVLQKCSEIRKYRVLSIMMQGGVIFSCAAIAQYLSFDFHAKGIVFIAILYYGRSMSKDIEALSCAIGAFVVLQEPTAMFSAILIRIYNGQRGMRMKYLFYFIYPVHILLFAVIKMLI